MKSFTPYLLSSHAIVTKQPARPEAASAESTIRGASRRKYRRFKCPLMAFACTPALVATSGKASATDDSQAEPR